MSQPSLRYIRVKRAKTTVFLEAEPGDTIGFVKDKLSKIVDMPVESIRLSARERILEPETRTMSEFQIENDDVVAMVYKNGDDWEAVDIVPVTQPTAMEPKKEEG